MRSYSWHSHIKKLESDIGDQCDGFNTGLIGINTSRDAAKMIANLIKKKKGSQMLIFTGNMGAGKTALAFAIAKEIGHEIPFQTTSGAEIRSEKKSVTLLLRDYCRKAIGINLLESVEVYEGELIDVMIDNLDCPKNKLSSGNVNIMLKTLEGSLRLKLHESLSASFVKENPKIGDIIRIFPINEIVRILGNGKSYKSNELNNNQFSVSLPKGKVYKKKNILQKITLFDLDYANLNFSRKKDNDQITLSHNLCMEVDNLLKKYIREKKAELIPGILFIDEAHVLEEMHLTYLAESLEFSFCPLIVLATNRETNFNFEKCSGSLFPKEFVKKCTNILVTIQQKHLLSKIVAVRAKNLNIVLTGNCLLEAGFISENISLRFGLMLINIAKFLMRSTDRVFINLEMISTVAFFFLNYRDSMQLLFFGKRSFSIYRIF